MKIRRRYPNYFSGFEETEHEVKTLKDVKEIDWVKQWSEDDMFHSYAGSDNLLMTVMMYDEKYGGCKSWWVIGHIIDGTAEDLGLKHYMEYSGHHLDDCEKSKFSMMSHQKECTCGFKKFKIK